MKDTQYYVLKNGRKVKENDIVKVTLTPRIIDFFTSIGAMTPINEGSDTDIDDTFDKYFNDIYKLLGL